MSREEAVPSGGRALALPAIVVPALLGAGLLLVATRRGAYTSPDGAFYVGVAGNLLDGKGFLSPPGSVPLSHFPPLFPVLLALGAKITGSDPLAVAGWINPLLLGAAAALLGSVTYRWTASPVAAAVAGTAAIVSLDLLVYFGSALSEPLFLVLMVAALASLARYLEEGRTAWLVAGGGFAAGATLTRYTGAALIVTGLLVVLLRARATASAGGRATRLAGGAATFVAVAALPVVAWMARAGSGDRVMAWHPPGSDFLLEVARSLSLWLVPRWVPWPARGWIAMALGAVAVTVVVVVWARRSPGDGTRLHPRPPTSLLAVLGSFVGAYLGLIVTTRWLLDESSDLDARLLLPLHVAAILTAALLVSFWAPRAGQSETTAHWVRGAVGVGVAGLLVLHGAQAGTWVVDGVSDDSVTRRGLTASAWEHSAVMARVAELAAEVEVYSNAPDAIHLLTGRSSSALPARRNYLTGEAAAGYDRQMDDLARAVAGGRAVVARFHAARWRDAYLPAEDDLVRRLDLMPLMSDAVGTLFTSRPELGAQARSSSATR